MLLFRVSTPYKHCAKPHMRGSEYNNTPSPRRKCSACFFSASVHRTSIAQNLTCAVRSITIHLHRAESVLPHRYPFLLIDKIEELEEGKRIKGIKNVTINEPFFQGHFPGNPIMPGVLICEALAQAGAVMLLSMPENKGKLGVFTGINNFKFRRQVVPGDTLELNAELTMYRHGMGKANVKATVGGQVAAMGEISFAVIDNAAEN